VCVCVSKHNKIQFKEKPGLSNYESNPRAAADSVAILLAKARDIVPPNMWMHTPLTLKATAGLRLLPDDKADRILDEVFI
jgi:ectonucleoside triphosphate diphosphohydrolase 5/6